MSDAEYKKDYNQRSNPRPDKVARVKLGQGKNAHFESIGAVWTRDDGSEYVKLHGKQIVDQGFYIFDLNSNAPEDESPHSSME